MGEFWSEVGKAAIQFVILVAVAGGGVFLGIKLRMKKDASTGKQI